MADTLFPILGSTIAPMLGRAAVMQRLLSSEVDAPITLVTDRKGDYDDDDMKVVVAGNRLRRVGKKLELDAVNGESIGMMAFRDGGPELFVKTIEGLMRTDKGLKLWYLSAIDGLAQQGHVSVCDIHGLSWCEIDDRNDLDNANSVVSTWNGA